MFVSVWKHCLCEKQKEQLYFCRFALMVGIQWPGSKTSNANVETIHKNCEILQPVGIQLCYSHLNILNYVLLVITICYIISI